jgi:hypothetical protein
MIKVYINLLCWLFGIYFCYLVFFYGIYPRLIKSYRRAKENEAKCEKEIEKIREKFE